jgi:hypothetical protein
MNGNAFDSGAEPRAFFRIYRTFLVASALACLLTSQTSAHAQDLDEVTFSGVVTDQSGAVIPGATVTARLTLAKAVRTVVTDGAGRYRLVELPPGVYTLAATRAGFAEEKREVRTLSGESVRLDFTLRPAGVAAEQTVSGEAGAPPLDATRTVAGGALGREELERLPSLSLSPLDFVLLLGGVTEEPLAQLYSEILYVYETNASVYAPGERAHTEKLYVDVSLERAVG